MMPRDALAGGDIYHLYDDYYVHNDGPIQRYDDYDLDSYDEVPTPAMKAERQ